VKRPYQVTGLVLVLFAAFLVRDALLLKYYTNQGPGPGFFPVWASILLGFLGAIMFLQATFQLPDPMPEDFSPSRVGYMRIGKILLAMIFAVVFMEILGFRITLFTFILFILYGMERRGLISTSLVALASSLGLYYAIVTWLEVPLPTGPLGL
jgi:putative tricarboxylic transport membrane protein